MTTPKQIKIGVPCFLSLLALAACAPAGSVFTDEDRDAIADVVRQALDIANTSRAWDEYVRLFFTEDAVFLPPNGEAIRGHEAIHDFLVSYPPFKDLSFEQVDVDGSGDLAYVYGRYSLNLLDSDGATVGSDRGKFIELWARLENGSWKIHHDIFNSDLPLPEAASGN